jgi:hypothetical protein
MAKLPHRVALEIEMAVSCLHSRTTGRRVMSRLNAPPCSRHMSADGDHDQRWSPHSPSLATLALTLKHVGTRVAHCADSGLQCEYHSPWFEGRSVPLWEVVGYWQQPPPSVIADRGLNRSHGTPFNPVQHMHTHPKNRCQSVPADMAEKDQAI